MSQLVVLLMRGIAWLPLPVCRALGAALGWLLYTFAGKRRYIVQTNLRLCFAQMPAVERAQQTRAVFDYFAKAFVDRSWLWHGSEGLLQKRLQIIDPSSQLQQGLAGTVLFAPHFVGLDAGWTALNRLTQGRYATIYAEQKNKALDAWIKTGRSLHHNANAAPLLIDHHAGVRPIVKALRSGSALYLLPDMNYEPRDSLFPTFFGVTAATLPILSRYAALGGTPDKPCRVIPVTTRMVSGGYEVTLHTLWERYPTDDLRADTQRMNHELEQLIMRTPDMLAQYYWVHKRFKDQPEGTPSPY